MGAVLSRIVHFTSHARSQMRLRNISAADVRTVLVFGEHGPTGTRPGRPARRLARAMLRGREAHVVYTETERRLLVITVEWAADEGGRR